MKAPVASLLTQFSPDIQQIVAGLFALIETCLPDPVVSVDGGDIGLGFGTGYKGLVFVITPFAAYVRLGLAGGASLADPEGLLEGRGRVHRHIKLRVLQALEDPALLTLIEAAVTEAFRRRNVGK